MNRIIVAIVLGVMFLVCGCSEEVASIKENNSQVAEKNVRTLHSTKRVYAKNIIPRAENLGDDWIEVDKQVVSRSRNRTSGNGATAESDYVLLNSDTAEIVDSNPAIKTIARSIYSHYDVEEPVALSVTWIMSGKDLNGFDEKDLYTLNRIYGFSDWVLEEKGVATAMPTGDIYPGFKKSMFAVNNPVAMYMAVDGGLIEVRASGELSPTDFTNAIEVVKAGVLKNIKARDGKISMPENIKVFWNEMQKCML